MAIESMDASGQIGVLRSRGMVINNASFARDRLNKKNYYNVINAFKSLFLKSTEPEIYITNTTFEEIYAMYEFDVRLRELFLKYILIAETELKTNISREISLQFNSSAYFSKGIYDVSDKNKDKAVKDFQETLFNLYKKNITNPMISHFIDKGDMVPLWAFINVFDFGTMRSFYNLLDENIKRRISNLYGISINQLYSILSGMNQYRNICAHSNRLYNYRIREDWLQISNMNLHSNMHIDTIRTRTGDLYIHGKKDLFSMVIALRYLLTETDFKSFYYQLDNRINHLKFKLKVINIQKVLDEMGFPSGSISGQLDWKNVIRVSK